MAPEDTSKSIKVPAGSARPTVPARIRAIFGEPPLLLSENRDAYEALESELVIAIDPHDIREVAVAA
jgi:hypothetical protein